jgi:hypothetical protein
MFWFGLEGSFAKAESGCFKVLHADLLEVMSRTIQEGSRGGSGKISPNPGLFGRENSLNFDSLVLTLNVRKHLNRGPLGAGCPDAARCRVSTKNPPTTPCVKNLLHSYVVIFALFSPTILTWRTHPDNANLVSQSTPKPALNAGHVSLPAKSGRSTASTVSARAAARSTASRCPELCSLRILNAAF